MASIPIILLGLALLLFVLFSDVSTNVTTKKAQPWPSYGSISFDDGDTPAGQTIGTSYTKIDQFQNNGSSSGVTPDHTNDQITIDTPGVYKITVDGLSYSGTANTTFNVTLYIDGVQEASVFNERKLGTAGDVGCAPFGGPISCPNGTEVLDLRVKADGASKTFTVEACNFNVFLIRPV